jgi:hypothetical protein
VICLPTRCSGRRFIAIAIATSSAVYRFCSVLAPSVTKYIVSSLPVIMPRVLWIAPSILTTPLLVDKLVVICMLRMEFAMFIASSALRLIVAGSCSFYRAIT